MNIKKIFKGIDTKQTPLYKTMAQSKHISDVTGLEEYVKEVLDKICDVELAQNDVIELTLKKAIAAEKKTKARVFIEVGIFACLICTVESLGRRVHELESKAKHSL